MRPSKPISSIVLVLLLLQTSGCYSFRAIQKPLPHGDRGWEYSQEQYRLLLAGGRSVELFNVIADSLTISGLAVDGSGRWTVQQAEVLAVQERVLSGLKTLGVVALVGIPFGIALFSSTFSLGGLFDGFM